MQLGHHADCTLRTILNETFADLFALSHYSELTRDALRELDFSAYKFLGKFSNFAILLISTLPG